MILLETERLTLRLLCEADFEDFCAYAMDDHMSRMMGRDFLHTKEEARITFHWLTGQFLPPEVLSQKDWQCYALMYKPNSKVIGNITVNAVPKELAERPTLRGSSGAALSFCLSRFYQRQGLMTEALGAMIRHLFEEEHLDYIQCGYYDFNAASKGLQEKLGFGHLLTQRIPDGDAEITAMENVLWNPKT